MNADRKTKLFRAADSLHLCANMIKSEALALMNTNVHTCQCCGIARYERFTQKNLADKLSGIVEQLGNIASRFERSVASDDDELS